MERLHTQTDQSQQTSERAEWLAETLAAEGVAFSGRNSWETLAEHIEVHQYFLSQNLGFPVSWEEAMFSWYDNIYAALKRATNSFILRRAFPNQENGDLMLAVSDHWHYLKQRDDNATIQDAARSFAEHYGSGLARFFSQFIVTETV